MKQLIKPRPLRKGDRIAAISPSWGGPSRFPERYQAGKKQLEEALGVTVVEMPNTLADAQFLSSHPEARADDLMRAFIDPDIACIVATIGGEDSIRLLPYVDVDVIRSNPKIFLGFSDITALHLACHRAGLASFYGPTIMAGFAENGGIHGYTLNSLKTTLMTARPDGLIPPNLEGWTAERVDWSAHELQGKRRRLEPPTPARILQGRGSATGHLLGGCAEVLEMAKGTPWWPTLPAWDGAILFYETSEDAPPTRFLRYWFRNFHAQGILERLSGILLARPDPAGRPDYQEEIESVVMGCLEEAHLTDLPVMSRLDFGHTQPMLTLPYGALAKIDCERCELAILESAVGD